MHVSTNSYLYTYLFKSLQDIVLKVHTKYMYIIVIWFTTLAPYRGEVWS